MPGRYAKWMYDWEDRLTSVDNNRVVRPLDWGVEWAHDWPCRNGVPPGAVPRDPEKFFAEYNQRIIARSDEFYSYKTPTDFRLERRQVQVFSTREVPDLKLEKKVRGTCAEFLRFTSPVKTPYPENNLVNARWFPARGRRAVVLLPHWNADAVAYTGLCKVLNLLGVAVLRLSLPYHDIRMPAEIGRADYAVSANIGRTLDAVRQGVVDIRSCFDWLEQQGYPQLGLVGTSLGSHGVLRQVCALSQAVAGGVRRLRHDVPAGVFAGSGARVLLASSGSQGRRSAMRPLYDRGSPLQIYGRVAPGELSTHGFRLSPDRAVVRPSASYELQSFKVNFHEKFRPVAPPV